MLADALVRCDFCGKPCAKGARNEPIGTDGHPMCAGIQRNRDAYNDGAYWGQRPSQWRLGKNPGSYRSRY